MKVLLKVKTCLSRDCPESFNVLVKELQSLALNVDLIESDILTESPVEIDETQEQ